MIPFNDTIISAVANTGTVVSSAIDANFLAYLTAQASFTDGTAAGTLKIQGSNDPANPPSTSSYNDIASAAATVASGALTTTPVLAAPLCYRWVRVSFTSSGGAGTFTVNVHGWGY